MLEEHTFEKDTFEENLFEDNKLPQQKIHIRIQQRNAKKSITIIEGLNKEIIDFKRIKKDLSKKYNCFGFISDDVIQLSGDQRNNVLQFLISENIATKDNIVIHGF